MVLGREEISAQHAFLKALLKRVELS
jgi:hypothetical protein